MRETVVFFRQTFVVLVAHWALLVLAAPVIAFFGDKNSFGIYWILAFFSYVILLLATPARKLITGTGHRAVHPKLKWIARIAVVFAVILFLLAAVGAFLLREGGPQIHDGVYVLWDHRVIREITREEYLRLSMIRRGVFCSGIAAMASLSLYLCCHADEII